MPGPAGLLIGRAHVTGASWGWALGRIESVQCPVGLGLHPVLSQQPQPGWADHQGLQPLLQAFLNLTSGQSHSEAARPTAQDVSFPQLKF